MHWVFSSAHTHTFLFCLVKHLLAKVEGSDASDADSFQLQPSEAGACSHVQHF